MSTHAWIARAGTILVIAGLAVPRRGLRSVVVTGAEGGDTVVWAKARLSWLKTFLVRSSGVPCPDTFSPRVPRSRFDEARRVLFKHDRGAGCSMLDQLVAIDSKTTLRSPLRGTMRRLARERGQKALHVVTAWVAERGVQLGQRATEEKSKEIAAIPALLGTLDIRGARR